MVAGSMHRLVLALLIGVAQSIYGQGVFVNTLMPQPKRIEPGNGNGLVITPQLTVALDSEPSAALDDAVARMTRRLQDETGISLSAGNQTKQKASIIISVSDVRETRPFLGVDESYEIDAKAGVLHMHAATLFGAYDAIETLLQMVQPEGAEFVIPAVHIVDAPRFAWRGLLLDPGRRFLSVATILRSIDGMAAVKLNVLHLHLSEDHGFRLESKRFPKLQEQGSGGRFYTQAQMRMIIAYASARGIRVVPEFDMPGHSTSWLVGYAQLASGSGPYHIEQNFGIFNAAMDPTRESTYAFLDEFFGEMVQLFPDEYVHIGGDESNGKEWEANPAIRRFMKAHGMQDTKALQAYFNKRVRAILQKHGRKMIGWDEILHPDLSPEVVVQNWHGTQLLIDSARQGHQGILSKPYYLDHTYSAAQMYAADPIPEDVELTGEEKKKILGGEACMWGEITGPGTLDSRIWPRAAAVAERLWSPQQTRDLDDMYRRLRVESLRLDALGLQQISGPQRLRRQLMDQESTSALDVLASTLQPIDFPERSHRQHLSQDSPLTNMVDIVVPDPPLEHQFRKLVETYLHDSDEQARSKARGQLMSLFQTWIASGAELTQIGSTNPRLRSLTERSMELEELGKIGRSAIDAHEHGDQTDAAGVADALHLLQQAEKPDESLTVFIVLKPLRELIAKQSNL